MTSPDEPGAPDVSASFKASSSSVSFEAYGRHFDLELEANDRVAPSTVSRDESLRLMRGVIRNTPGSWVRLASVDGALSGMIWDGSQLFLIESATTIRNSLIPPLVATAGETVIFRLADTVVSAGTMCDSPTGDAGSATTGKPRSGQQAYDSMLRELKGGLPGMQAAGASKRIELSTLGDALFRAEYGSDTQATSEILVRINNVDGIYSSQLGVAVQAASVDVSAAATATLSTTTDGSALLTALGKLRKATPGLNVRGLTHLFTGRDLVSKNDLSDATPVGIAYTDALCLPEFGAGLTEVRGRGSWFESLIAAHEIGHNFGAVHDGTEACANSPVDQFLMSPTINAEHSTFSSCSLGIIVPRIQLAACVTALPPPDLSVASDLGTLHKGVSRSFEILLPVTNVGGITATATHAQLLVPPSLIVEDVFVAGGTCTSGAGSISCDLGDMTGGETRQVHLTLRGDTLGTNSFSAQVTAAGDSQSSNNKGDGTIVIDREADLAIDLQVPSSGVTATSFVASFTVTNLAAIASTALTVDIDLPAGTTATSATAAGIACTVQASLVHCSLPSLAANGTVSGSVSLITQSAGATPLRARVTGTYVDPNAANDSVERTVAITAAEVTPPPTASTVIGKRGGGDTGLLLVLALGLTAAARSQVKRAFRHR